MFVIKYLVDPARESLSSLFGGLTVHRSLHTGLHTFSGAQKVPLPEAPTGLSHGLINHVSFSASPSVLPMKAELVAGIPGARNSDPELSTATRLNSWS